MAVEFYDVNFNQSPDLEQTNIPAISGYIIDDDAYTNRSSYEGSIPMEHVISSAQTTSNLMGAISMNRKMIAVGDKTVATCELKGYDHFIYVEYTDAGPINVTICDESGNIIETLVLPYLENNSNLSLVGHFNANDELDWATVGYTYRDEETGETYLFINTNGFSLAIKDELKPYVYLRYKYPYQVVIQKSLNGTDGFELSRFPDHWYNRKMYGTGEGQSQKFNEFVCRHDTEPEIVTVSAAWKEIRLQNELWLGGKSNVDLSIDTDFNLTFKGFSFGSDIFRLLPDGKYYNGVDLNKDNCVVRGWTRDEIMHRIDFSGGSIIIKCGYNIHDYMLQLLDNAENVIDSFQFAAPTGIVGDTAINYQSICSCYLTEHNNHYYIIGLRQFRNPVYDDDGNQIRFPDVEYPGRYYEWCCSYEILHIFNNNANNLLYKGTNAEKIVPKNPDELTGDETSNQTSDADNKNEFGNEIPHPKYSDGEWGDGTSEGIRGSGQGQQTGGDAEGKLDEQPGLPGKPDIPTPVSTGFMKLYAPTESEVQDLCIELTDDSILETLKKYFGNNPLDFIVGLQVVPGDYTKDTSKYKIKYGSYASDVSMYPITDEFTTLDYGELDLKEIYGSWEDYNPHTKMSIYLPYIGIKEIDPDKINGTTLKLKYHIDAITGSILAVLTSVRNDGEMTGKEIVVGQWPGQATYTIPLTNTQHDASVNAVLGIVGATAGIGLAVATGGASALVTAGAVGSVGNALLSGAKSQKTDISMQGSVGGSLSFFTGTDAYIQIEFPKEGRPDDYNHIIGMPSNITTTLAEQPLNSYIEFVNVDVSGIDAPTDEKNAIINLLKGGVYT